MMMVPTPRWNPVPIHFGTMSPERVAPLPPQECIHFGTPEQLLYFNRNLVGKGDEAPELMLNEE